MRTTLRYWLVRAAWRATEPGSRSLIWWTAGYVLAVSAVLWLVMALS